MRRIELMSSSCCAGSTSQPQWPQQPPEGARDQRPPALLPVAVSLAVDAAPLRAGGSSSKGSGSASGSKAASAASRAPASAGGSKISASDARKSKGVKGASPPASGACGLNRLDIQAQVCVCAILLRPSEIAVGLQGPRRRLRRGPRQRSPASSCSCWSACRPACTLTSRASSLLRPRSWPRRSLARSSRRSLTCALPALQSFLAKVQLLG